MTRRMHPNSKASRCLQILREGPATTDEIAIETGWSGHLAGAHMHLLFKRGKVTRAMYQQPHGRPCWLWSLKEPA